MAPGQTVEIKDLPQELTAGGGGASQTAPGQASSQATAVLPMFSGENASLTANGNETQLSELEGLPTERSNWIMMLEAEAAQMLSDGKPEVMDALGRQFESALIKIALRHTHGRKNDAAIRLGIGRNTITRKIQELGMDERMEEKPAA